ALQDISLDRKTRNYYEMRLKTERDHEATIEYAFEEGLKKGKEESQHLASIREKRAEHKKALRTAINLKKEGAELKFISRVVELQEAYLEKFLRKSVRDSED
ncbi:MAG: hypothetical protein KDK45_23065, partial [Leptospiraceae bacterium]|nr:hypothetical protein [Leptospiraceae bacterium]